MREFLDIATSFPVVVFSISTFILLGFWVVSTLAGAGINALDDLDLDLDAETDIDVDGDIELDSDSTGGLVRSALDFLGITGMPLLLALNLLSLFAWFIAYVAMTILGGSDSTIGWILGIPVLIGSFLVSGFITGRIARKFAHVFVPTLAAKQREFVGSVCTITTQRVTATFGQAEVRDSEGGSLIVQVRCDKENDLQAGDRALIFDLDKTAGIFQISPDKSLAP